jgi:D-alanine-D-alanine ligase-like ATP-grasp enzyme
VKTVYTTTITQEARRRGIGIEVIDAETPIFILSHGGRKIRCYNSLTDRVGAVTFHMAQDKRMANAFLARYGFSVPRQMQYSRLDQAMAFLAKYKSVVVKPCREWGGRGVSVAVTTMADLKRAIERARKFSEDVVIEQYVEGVDHRLIFVDGRFVAAIRREPACVVGNGASSIRSLILQKNARACHADASNRIPLDAETRRNLAALSLDYGSVPRKGKIVQVRLTSNYHTGGSVIEITETVSTDLVREAQKIVHLFDIPVVGVDFLVNSKTGRHWVIELSPDLAISPPEGGKVARHFLDYLFPKAKPGAIAPRPIRAKRRRKRRKNNLLTQRPARRGGVAGGRKGANLSTWRSIALLKVKKSKSR